MGLHVCHILRTLNVLNYRGVDCRCCKQTGYTDNKNIFTAFCCDGSVREKWKLRLEELRRERKREQTEKKKKKSREEAADQSWVPTEITLFIHIKSFLNMDSREQSGSLSALRLWMTLHWHAPALHLQYSDCIKANTTTVSGHVWGEVRSMALAKTWIQNNKKSLYSKHVLFKDNLIWAAVQRSLLRDRVPVVIVRKAHVYINLIN